MRGSLEPVSIRAETVAVLRVGAFVFFSSLLLISLHATGTARGEAATASDLLPFQTLFADAPADRQRMFRAIQEGVLEAERVRASTKSWPAVEGLAGDGIPPFAADPIEKQPKTWSLLRDRLVLNYRGAPAVPGADEWLLLIQEPEPAAVDLSLGAGTKDETHHVLPDGTLLHVTLWVRPWKKETPGIVDRPFAEGWTQILAGSRPVESR